MSHLTLLSDFVCIRFTSDFLVSVFISICTFYPAFLSDFVSTFYPNFLHLTFASIRLSPVQLFIYLPSHFLIQLCLSDFCFLLPSNFFYTYHLVQLLFLSHFLLSDFLFTCHPTFSSNFVCLTFVSFSHPTFFIPTILSNFCFHPTFSCLTFYLPAIPLSHPTLFI